VDILEDKGVSKLSAKMIIIFFLKWTTPLSYVNQEQDFIGQFLTCLNSA